MTNTWYIAETSEQFNDKGQTFFPSKHCSEISTCYTLITRWDISSSKVKNVNIQVL